MKRSEHGFVAIEFALAVGVLLLPVVLLVVALPAWVERSNAAEAAARDGAVAAADAYPADGTDAARAAATRTAADEGVPASAVRVELVRDDHVRGGTVAVKVTVVMPALVVPGAGSVGGFEWSAVHARRIDDYRSG